MSKEEIKFKRHKDFEVVNRCLGKNVKMPVRSTRLASAYDMFAVEHVVIPSIWRGMSALLNSKDDNPIANPFRISGDNAILGVQMMTQEQSKEFVGNKDNKEFMSLFQPTRVYTGIKMCMEEDYWGLALNRSGTPSNTGLVLANGVGNIDADYYDKDGEIIFQYYNFFPYDIEINEGDKIGQILFMQYHKAVHDNMLDVQRNGGLGSTGVK